MNLEQCIILGSFFIDLIFGDPPLIFTHPVVLIGRLIEKLEKIFVFLWGRRKVTGFFLVIFILFFVFIGVKIILSIFSLFNDYLYFLFVAILGSFTISLRSLHIETKKVLDSLKKNNIEKAREELSFLVSRDTYELEERDIFRSVIETIAENITDGVIAPLFYFCIGGITGAYIYKAVNTLDSMIGYKNDKYVEFGFFAAKLDDVLNYIPARISGCLIIIVTFFLNLNYKNALKIILRDRQNCDSPNSGWTEAAVAGALNIQLGGPTPYFGIWYDKPFIGDEIEEISIKHIEKTYKILYSVSFLFIIIISLVK